MRRALLLALAILVLQAAACAQQTEVMYPVWSSELVPKINENINPILAGVEDINNDGYAEPYAVTVGWDSSSNLPQKNHVTAFLRNGSKVVNYGVDGKIRDALTYDINNDQNREFIVSSGEVLNNIQRGTVRLIGADGKLTQSFDSSAIMYDLIVDDLQKNRYYDIIGGSERKVFAFSRMGDWLWSYPAQGGGLLAKTVQTLYAYDVDDDGSDEVIAGSDILYYIDARGNLMGQLDVDPEEQSANKEIKKVLVGKVTDSAYPTTIAVTGTDLIKAVVITKAHKTSNVDLLTLNLTWTTKLGCSVNKISLKNLDADSMDEILVACSNNKFYALDNNGGILWSYPLDSEPTDYTIKDVDGDNIEDLVIGTKSGSLYVLDLSGKFKWLYDTSSPILKVAAGDVDGDKVNEVLVLNSIPNATLYAVNKTHLIEKNAAMMFSLGQNEYLKSQYLSALDYFKKARLLFIEAKDEKGVSDCDAIINKIQSENLNNQENDAKTYYDKAQDAYYAGNLESARTFVDKASELYTKLGMNAEVVKCELLRLQIDKAAGITPTSATIRPANVTTTTMPAPAGSENTLLLVIAGVLILLVAYGAYLKKKGGAKGGAFGPEKDFWEKDMMELEKEVSGSADGEAKK